MRRFAGVVLILLVAASAAAAAPAKRPPRFAVTITGRQTFEWTIDSPAPCAFKGHGTQAIDFASRPGITAYATENSSPPGAPPGKEFHLAVAGKVGPRVLPLTGTEKRNYESLAPPPPANCLIGIGRKYGESCQGTNSFNPAAGVVLLRNRQKL
jgi:hypothetical protein